MINFFPPADSLLTFKSVVLAKNRLLNFLLLYCFYLFQGLLCAALQCSYVLGVNTWFIANCLALTIDLFDPGC